MILCNPAIGCKCPPAKREEMKIPSGETMQRVLIQAKEENYYELFPLEFATGLRLRELAALQWDDLNLTTGELRIDKQASIVGSEVVICEPKTKAAVRTMILPPSVRRVLAEYKTKVDSRWMFPSPKKEDLPMRPSSPHKRLHRILDYAGCEISWSVPYFCNQRLGLRNGHQDPADNFVLCIQRYYPEHIFPHNRRDAAIGGGKD